MNLRTFFCDYDVVDTLNGVSLKEHTALEREGCFCSLVCDDDVSSLRALCNVLCVLIFVSRDNVPEVVLEPLVLFKSCLNHQRLDSLCGRTCVIDMVVYEKETSGTAFHVFGVDSG